MKAELLDILRANPHSLHAFDIRSQLAARGRRVTEHDLTRMLRHLLQEGQVEYRAGRWRPLGVIKEMPAGPKSCLSTPRLSAEARQLLGISCVAPDQLESTSSGEPQISIHTHAGVWGPFRALLQYYRDCIRNEGGAEAIASLADEHAKFLFFSKTGSWLPRPGQPWRQTLPLGGHLEPLVQQLSGSREDTLLVLGYPLQIFHVHRDDDPDMYLLKPVFYYPLEHALSHGTLVFNSEQAQTHINLDWIHHALSTPERRCAFLSACGFVGSDGDDPTCAGRVSPTPEVLTASISAFLNKNLREPLLPASIPVSPLRVPLKTGIYNRAVLMVARRPQFTRALLRELAVIAESPDSDLDKTALRFLFRAERQHGSVDRSGGGDTVSVADIMPLNSEQRGAGEALLNNPLTVVTGPPGTGKSQVVSALIANAHLCGQSILFASRNHKAIDAVYARSRIEAGHSLLVRCNSRDDPTLRATFGTAIGQLLAGSADVEAGKKAGVLIEGLRSCLAEREERLRQAGIYRDHQERLGELEEQISSLSLKLPEGLISALRGMTEGFPAEACGRLLKAVQLLTRPAEGSGYSLGSWITSLAAIPAWVRTGRYLRRIPAAPKFSGLICTPSRLATLAEHLELLRDIGRFCEFEAATAPLEEQVRSLPDETVLASAIATLGKQIAGISMEALETLRKARQGLLPGDNRELLANLRSALGYLEQKIAPSDLRKDAKQVLSSQVPKLLEHYPAWAVTSLSVGSRIPLLPGIFDLAIIDEASQSDIPSAIPLLFRARRAGVVGDPNQLTHVTNLSLAKDGMLRRRTGLNALSQQRFSYVETSLYSLFADTNGVVPAFLCETYRSIEEIAEYSNDLFYGGRLRVATDPSRLPTIPGIRPGIHWTETSGDVRSGGSGGAWCPEEIAAVTDIVRGILADGTYRGSLGVVTPFREQATRLRDSLHSGDIPWEALRAASVIVDTSHGFQGDERDIILFSLCAGPGMPQGALHFLRETGNLFNVAISRARAVVRVVGDRSWAKNCGIRHIERLTVPTSAVQHAPVAGPWSPYESPWEKRLAEALMAHGLSPIPQHPVAGRRLDLALIRSVPRSLKIDIEVDGACCHRNPDGSRKLDDIWRDIQLHGLGWRVMRFWVYQLREDMEGCVQKVLYQWRRDHEQPK